MFSAKKGSVAQGETWKNIVKRLNGLHQPTFNLKDKRLARDRWSLLAKKFKANLRIEEAASGMSLPEMTEKEVLIEELF